MRNSEKSDEKHLKPLEPSSSDLASRIFLVLNSVLGEWSVWSGSFINQATRIQDSNKANDRLGSQRFT